jgi:histidinol-phosphate phosphatase family protein
MSELRRAAFVDRDGTIIVDAHYISRPEQVRLVPGAAEALRRLNDAGVPVVVVTNQSGIARGTITEADYTRVAERVDLLVREAGASIDATYYCPHHPAITGACDCRKPGTGMFEQAAGEMKLDLRASLYVGDKWRDVAPGITLGGRAILVASPETPADDLARAERDAEVARSLGDAVIAFLSESAR